MELPTQILLTYGYLLLFGWVLVEQLGLPLPAAPVLLAAGALSADGSMSLPASLASGFTASLIADSVWFYFGRHWGHRVLRLLCKLSFEATTCVRRTRNSFGRRRGAMLVFAKFVPALSTLAPPVAGQSGMRFGAFLLYDGLGSALWVGALLAGGRCFAGMLERNPHLLDWAGRFSGVLLAVGIVGFFLVRLWRRHRALKKLAASRLDPGDLKRRLDAGEEVLIVDLRHPLEVAPEPFTLPGARLVSPETLTEGHQKIPRDRDVVLFCGCPGEATAAKTAMTLHRLGVDRARTLRGGFDEWRRLGFPVEELSLPETAPAL